MIYNDLSTRELKKIFNTVLIAFQKGDTSAHTIRAYRGALMELNRRDIEI